MTQTWRPSASPHMLAARARLLADIRAFMAEHGVLEVDTPVLASAPPAEAQLACFHVGEDAGYLVPSPEHALKRLVAAGSGPVYQLGHVFRAGEAGRWHNPEFTMLEWYRPGRDVAAVIDETGRLLRHVAGAGALQHMEFADLFAAHTGLDAHAATAAKLAAWADAAGLTPPGVTPTERADRSFWLDLIMSLHVEPDLGTDAPVCVRGFPADDAVLVALRDTQPPVAERFEIYWQGRELANGAQELCDAGLARERMQREQQRRVDAGLPVPPIDDKLLASLEAMPACAGVALGVDRLLAIMHGADCLADVLPFDWSRR